MKVWISPDYHHINWCRYSESRWIKSRLTITYIATNKGYTELRNALPIPAWVSHNGIQDQDSPSQTRLPYQS